MEAFVRGKGPCLTAAAAALSEQAKVKDKDKDGDPAPPLACLLVAPISAAFDVPPPAPPAPGAAFTLLVPALARGPDPLVATANGVWKALGKG